MAIFPEIFPDNRLNEHAEKAVYDRLSKLPDHFDVFYNNIVRGRSKAENKDYELDFIVADLRGGRFNGAIFIEVKGGIVDHLGGDRWTQNSRPTDSPVEQAFSGWKNYMKVRNSEMERRICSDWMVCFPDSGEPENHKLPDRLQQDQVIGYMKMTALKETLTYRFDQLRNMYPNRRGISLDEYEANFKGALTGPCGFILSLQTRIQADESEFIRLTKRQREIFRDFQFNDELLVMGTAGSGKTLIAKQAAQEFYEEGMNVLFLCYNKVLARNIEVEFATRLGLDINSYLNNIDVDLNNSDRLKEITERLEEVGKKKQEIAESRHSIRVDRYHSFACSMIEEADPGWWRANIGKYDEQTFWGERVPFKIMEIKESDGIRSIYDVIIIDEGQDFTEDWFITTKYFLKPDGRFYIFMDKIQNIYKSCPRPPKPKSQPHITIAPLRENCRNTKKITRKLSEIVQQEIPSMDGSPKGDDITIVKYKSKQDQQTKLLQNIRVLLKEGIRPDQILILLNTDKSHSCLAETKRIDNITLAAIGRSGGLSNSHINYSHIMDFKGLEADIVFIIDTHVIKGVDENLLYTQASRAKDKLFIFEKEG